MSPARFDDASGECFRMELEGLRQTRPVRNLVIPAADLIVDWEIEIHPPHSGAIRDAWGSICDHALYVVEMRDEFLARSPPQMPKISWSILEPGETELETITGGAAPTFEEAIVRAEIAARVRLGVAMDG